VLVTNRFRLEQKSYMYLHVFFFFLYDLIIKIFKNHGRSGKLRTIKRFLSTYNVCDLVSSTVRKFIHSIVFIGYKNVFGPIAVLVTNRFRLEQKSYMYLPLKLQFMSGFGKTTSFNGLLGNRPEIYSFNLLQNVHVRISFYRNQKPFCDNP
jgi:hypothetical protein